MYCIKYTVCAIFVVDVFISNLFCVSNQLTMLESSMFMLCVIAVMSVLSVA